MHIIVLEGFECYKCSRLVLPHSEAWLEELGTGFCAEFFDLMCARCGELDVKPRVQPKCGGA